MLKPYFFKIIRKSILYDLFDLQIVSHTFERSDFLKKKKKTDL